MVQCGWKPALTFVGALLAGTFSAIMSKMLLSLSGESLYGDKEPFQKPVFQTWGMFTGMFFSLPLYFAYRVVEQFVNGRRRSYEKVPEGDATVARNESWCPSTGVCFMLALPCLFDMTATILNTIGLTQIPVSTYQVLRGGCIVFVAILKHFVLKDRLERHMWCGVAIIVCAIALVGLAAFVDGKASSSSDANPLLGVGLVLLGGAIQAVQYVFEEKVMSDDAYNASPIFLIGMEGFWGLLICTIVVIPVMASLPGNDHGVVEDPENTLYMFMHSSEIQTVYLLRVFAIFLYNMLSVLVTYYLDSVWHAILDNFRPITVWLVDLVLHYYVLPSFGEDWTNGSYLQLFALGVLLYGTAVYNGSSRPLCLSDQSDENEESEKSHLLTSPTLSNSPLFRASIERRRDSDDAHLRSTTNHAHHEL